MNLDQCALSLFVRFCKKYIFESQPGGKVSPLGIYSSTAEPILRGGGGGDKILVWVVRGLIEVRGRLLLWVDGGKGQNVSVG